MRLVLVGYWRTEDDPNWPDVLGFVDHGWEADEREIVSRYLRHGTLVRPYLGMSTCRICGCHNGASELTDGVYLWPEGLAHYLDEHDVRPPQELVDHVRRRTDELDAATVDERWWRDR